MIVDTRDHKQALRELLTACRKCPKSFTPARRRQIRTMVGAVAHELSTHTGVERALAASDLNEKETDFLTRIWPEHYPKPYPEKWPRLRELGLGIQRAKDRTLGISATEITRVFTREGLLEKWAQWSKGITFGPAGAYPWDVERFLNGGKVVD